MRPFQVVRFWAHRAPVPERITVGVAVLAAVALLGWLVIPEGRSDTADVFAAGPAAPGGLDDGTSSGRPDDEVGGGEDALTASDGGAADGGTGPAAGQPTGDGATGAPAGETGTPAGAGAPRSEGGCVSPPGSVQGIDDDQITVAVVLTQIVGPAANELFDVPPPDEARADFEAVFAGINNEGGVACRTLVPEFYIANPTDESQMMGLCRDIADAGHFAVVDTGSLATRPAVLACFGQLKVPYFGAFFISDTARRQFYPYLYSVYTLEHLFSSTAFALRERGFFDPAGGFQKLGFAYRNCERQTMESFRGWIREAGVPDGKVVTYNVGCPAVFASESDLAQAVQRFRDAGVTHVILASMQGDYQRFTEQAELQGFRPQYAFPDEALISTADGTRRPNPRNMAGALAITLARDAEQHTPGMGPTPGTEKCNAYRAAAGLPTVYEARSNAGNACSQLWMLRAAVDNAPELSHAALPVGLQRTGRLDFSFPQGMADFSREGTTSGGQFYRVARFEEGCERRCWRVIQPEFRRGPL